MLYNTIVIDYPWSLKNLNLKKYPKKIPYKTMSNKEVLKFDLNRFADKDCDLFIWTTHSKLPLCFKILERYGFKYHCVLTWHKNIGLNVNGFIRNSEFVVYGYRGKSGLVKDCGKFIKCAFSARRKKHSEKPDIFYEMIRGRTSEPRIDIFNRRPIFGFDSWGDEKPDYKQIFIGDL